MKIIYITLALLFTMSVAAVATLYFLQPAPVKNGFNRGHTYSAQKMQELELKFSYWYITWLGESNIHLGNYKAGLNLFSCNFDLQDTIYRKLSFKDGSRLRLELLKNDVIKQIEPNGDGFSTDGFVTTDDATGRTVFTYYYRNSFVYLDPDLKVLYKARLIDTNSVAKIELGEYKLGHKTIRTMAKPGLMVNKRGYIDGNWFYNHAALAADNESLKDFDRHEVIDVYELSDGRYSHSVYLPKYPKRKLTDFALRGDTLIALYEKVLVSYQLNRKEVALAK